MIGRTGGASSSSPHGKHRHGPRHRALPTSSARSRWRYPFGQSFRAKLVVGVLLPLLARGTPSEMARDQCRHFRVGRAGTITTVVNRTYSWNLGVFFFVFTRGPVSLAAHCHRRISSQSPCFRIFTQDPWPRAGAILLRFLLRPPRRRAVVASTLLACTQTRCASEHGNMN